MEIPHEGRAKVQKNNGYVSDIVSLLLAVPFINST
jgi:hypothetical protein